VLVEAQSVDEFLSRLNNREANKVVVVSVSPQSLASLAEHYKLSITQCYQKLNFLFTSHLGCTYFFDTNFSRDFALLEQAAEFVARYRAKQQQQQQQGQQGQQEQATLPLLTSACPGSSTTLHKSICFEIFPFLHRLDLLC